MARGPHAAKLSSLCGPRRLLEIYIFLEKVSTVNMNKNKNSSSMSNDSLDDSLKTHVKYRSLNAIVAQVQKRCV